MQRVLIGLALALFVIAPVTRGSAQPNSSLTETDIQRLQTAVADARADVDRARAATSSWRRRCRRSSTIWLTR
jgi:hypothetical protein